MNTSNNSGNSNKPDTLTFFNQSNQRENSQEDVEFRSRSMSSASNNSFKSIHKWNFENKKYFNLAALDGFAMMENEEEEKYRVNNTVLKNTKLDQMFDEIDDHHNMNLHLDKLFDENGPYSQTHRFENGRKKSKKNRKKSPRAQRNFLDRIDSSLLREDSDSVKDFGTKALFEDPEEKEIRINQLNNRIKSKKSKQAHKKQRQKLDDDPPNAGVFHLPFASYT